MKSVLSWMLALAVLAIGVSASTAQAAEKKRKVIDFVFHELDANGDKSGSVENLSLA